MGKPSRDKGARRERQVVQMHVNMGVHAERVPLSGAMRFRNTEKTDVDVYARGKAEAPFVCEVKARASGEGFVTLERWLGDADALFLIRDRATPLVVLPWTRWAELLVADAAIAATNRPDAGNDEAQSRGATGLQSRGDTDD